MRRIAFFIVLLVVILSACQKEATIVTLDDAVNNNTFVHQKGMEIIDTNGNSLLLKGVILEGWLHWGGPMWGAGFTSEKDMENKLVKKVGQAAFDDFRKDVYDNFIVEEDIVLMKEMGYNCIRLPFNHTVLEDDASPFQYKDSGWELLDKTIGWCKANGLYVVLDLHATACGQSNAFIADPDKKLLWESNECKDRTITIWQAIAERYKNEKAVAGYDLINEPDPKKHAELADLYLEIARAIREVDANHMLIIEGAKFAKKFSFFNAPVSHNMVYSFHTYNLLGNGDSKQKEQKEALEIAIEQNVPIWNGEFGANTLDWTEATLTYFSKPENQVSGWIFWPWKRIKADDESRYRHLLEISSTNDWNITKEYIAGSEDATQEQVKKGMQEFITNCKVENCSVDTEMQNLLSSFTD